MSCIVNDPLPLAEFDIYTITRTKLNPIQITAQLSTAKLMTAGAPLLPNCWRYVRQYSNEHLKTLLNTPLEVPLGPIIDVRRNLQLKIHWINTLPASGVPPVLDQPPTGLSMVMNPDIGIVPHLHGGEVAHNADGWPLNPLSFPGNPYRNPDNQPLLSSAIYTYPNRQRANMLWFHDHAMDNTAPNVYAGLAGLYFIRDDSDKRLFSLLGGKIQAGELMELPLVIQDRLLKLGQECFDYPGGFQGGRMEFLGDCIFVNGRAQPSHSVQPKRYRLRILNGSNARTYALALVERTGAGIWRSERMTAIGNDGGLYAQKNALLSTDYLLLSPGERLDVMVDFSAINAGTQLTLVNLAVQSLKQGDNPEAIFQNAVLSVTTDLAWVLGCTQGIIMNFVMLPLAGTVLNRAVFEQRLDKILLDYAMDADPLQGGQQGFVWQVAQSKLRTQHAVKKNRFIILMNSGGVSGSHPYTQEGQWHDTQIWEMSDTPPPLLQQIPVGGNNTVIPYPVPFDIAFNTPVQGKPSAPKDYFAQRCTFFDPVYQNQMIGIIPQYPPLAKATIKPKANSYERWYVANLGFNGAIPDMHPFHMHLVNFVVHRRFELQGNRFVEITGRDPTDGKVRHDTVRVNSNELLELLVFFPAGYSGIYPYHCHLVEHEDMGMMLHFEVQP